MKLLGGIARLLVEQVAVALQKEEPHHRRFPSRAGDEGLGQTRQPLARGPARRLRLLEHLGRPARRGAVQVVQELLLAGEVTVNRPFRDAGLLGDFGRRRGLIPTGREVLEGGAREALAGQIGDRHRPRI